MVKNLFMSKAEKAELNKPKSGIFRTKGNALPTGVTRRAPSNSIATPQVIAASPKP